MTCSGQVKHSSALHAPRFDMVPFVAPGNRHPSVQSPRPPAPSSEFTLVGQLEERGSEAGIERCLYGCYVHSSIIPTFHRRCYWLLQFLAVSQQAVGPPLGRGQWAVVAV
ncbi:hypothetical protein AAFF_G00207160 [Aldrovandia affinis]|uniref:CG-1 domain-containing protein n=1 Tax=Aldrovandia affinis TaxID=143900 RepID=A0AAD7W5K9_9TELE|nr:hypothetical protein AAFF_G00207160 [Aldrovandia affinis]